MFEQGSRVEVAPTHEHESGRAPGRARYASIALALGVVVLVLAGLLFTDNGFVSDFTNTLWLGSVQASTVTHGLIPSYFYSATAQTPLPVAGYYYPYAQTGLFEPIFAFYGGTLFAVFGLIAHLFGGNVVGAFELLTGLAVIGAYFGLFDIAKRCHCGAIGAHAAAVTFVASAYYVTDLYGRGDWSEFVGVSAIPVVVSGALGVFLDERVRVRSIVLLYVGVVFFSGSHVVVLVWASLFIALLVLALLAARVVSLPPLRRLALTAVVALVGLGTNGWTLVPEALYAGRTYFAKTETVIGTPFVDTFSHLFDPFRQVPSQSNSPGLYVQMPFWMLIWALAVYVYCRTRRADRAIGGRAFAACSLVGGIVLVFMLNRQIWNYVPHLLRSIQNPYILSTYLTLSVAALVITASSIAGRLAQTSHRAGRIITASLVMSCAITLALAGWQAIVPNDRQPILSYPDRYNALVSPNTLPYSWYAQLDYAEVNLPIYAVTPARTVTFPSTVVNAHGDGADFAWPLPIGYDPIATNIIAAPDFTHIGGGVAAIGETRSGYLVIQRTAGGSDPVPIVITSQAAFGERLGQLLSAVVVVFVVLIAILAATLGVANKLRSRRSRKRPALA